MIVYRLAKKEYIRDLSGEGARLYGGRWNMKGQRMLYTSTLRSLAVLEMMVHQEQSLWSNGICFASIEVPDVKVKRIEWSVVSKLIDSPQSNQEFQKIGSDWLAKNELAIEVPSVIVPQEFHLILNPNALKFNEVKIIDVMPFMFDKRFNKEK